jgi:hypothetical protein
VPKLSLHEANLIELPALRAHSKLRLHPRDPLAEQVDLATKLDAEIIGLTPIAQAQNSDVVIDIIELSNGPPHER